jgi:hypothetical protein
MSYDEVSSRLVAYEKYLEKNLLIKGEESTIISSYNEFKLHQLTCEEAYIREGNVMGHCIGKHYHYDGGYDAFSVRIGKNRIASGVRNRTSGRFTQWEMNHFRGLTTEMKMVVDILVRRSGLDNDHCIGGEDSGLMYDGFDRLAPNIETSTSGNNLAADWRKEMSQQKIKKPETEKERYRIRTVVEMGAELDRLIMGRPRRQQQPVEAPVYDSSAWTGRKTN